MAGPSGGPSMPWRVSMFNDPHRRSYCGGCSQRYLAPASSVEALPGSADWPFLWGQGRHEYGRSVWKKDIALASACPGAMGSMLAPTFSPLLLSALNVSNSVICPNLHNPIRVATVQGVSKSGSSGFITGACPGAFGHRGCHANPSLWECRCGSWMRCPEKRVLGSRGIRIIPQISLPGFALFRCPSIAGPPCSTICSSMDSRWMLRSGFAQTFSQLTEATGARIMQQVCIPICGELFPVRSPDVVLLLQGVYLEIRHRGHSRDVSVV